MAAIAPVVDTPPSAPPSETSRWEARIGRALFAPIDIGMLVFFRVSFGVIMLVESYRYLSNGWVYRNYIDPDFHFTFYGFSWVRTWPGDGMFFSFYAMGILAACIAAGFLYRVTTVLFFLNFAHIFLSDQTYYLNHFYLVTLISLMMCFLPAHRAWSVDVLIWPKIYSPTVPVWTLRLIQFHVAVAYFFGGIAKINGDWFLGEPMRSSLREHLDFPLIGQWFTEEWMVALFTWGGLLFDLLIVPALIWPRTRLAAFFAALLFHLSNSIMFEIGIFPWFMVAATILFFPPEWLQVEGSANPQARDMPRNGTLTRGQKATVLVLGAYVLAHLVVPFRHLAYPGDVSWTEEGHLYAWHMKLRRKSGEAHFTAVTQDGQRLSERVLLKHATPEQVERVTARVRNLSRAEQRETRDDYLYITPRQRKKMSGRPDMIVQYAHFLADEFRKHGYGEVAIYCDTAVSLNGRPRQQLVDPEIDLTRVELSLRPASWIVPLKFPLTKTGTVTGESDSEEGE